MMKAPVFLAVLSQTVYSNAFITSPVYSLVLRSSQPPLMVMRIRERASIKKKSLQMPAPLSSLVSPDDAWAVWSCLTVAAAGGSLVGTTTRVGARVSPPVCAMFLGFLMSNCGVLPAGGSPHIGAAQALCVRLATPLLLFGADLRKVLKEARQLLPSFALGTLGTLLGSAVGFALLNGGASGGSRSDFPAVAAALCAKNIGGGVNFVAVAQTLRISTLASAAALTVDNVMALLYFPFCDWISRRSPLSPSSPSLSSSSSPSTSTVASTSTPAPAPAPGVSTPLAVSTPFTAATAEAKRAPSSHPPSSTSEALSSSPPPSSPSSSPPLLFSSPPSPSSSFPSPLSSSSSESTLTALAVAVTVVAVCEHFCPHWSIVASTALTVALATFFPRWLGSDSLVDAGQKLGSVFLFVFFATAGAAGAGLRSTLIGSGPRLFAFLAIVYSTHLSVVLGFGGRFLGMDRRRLLVASNANIGGPATAGALCVGQGWKDLTTPALLVGNLGYAVANLAALSLYALWTKTAVGL